MARLLVHVEGETEETFVNEVLNPHLLSHGYKSVSARLVGNARLRSRRGGIKAWSVVKQDIIKHLKEDRRCIATTMVDYYGLPRSGAGAWPGRAEAPLAAANNRAHTVEVALLEDVAAHLGADFDQRRFIPFIVMHEFEGLLFSDCEAFAQGVGMPGLADQLQAIRNQFPTPEDINDSPVTAPSKRVEAIISGYTKPIHGNLAALMIGLDSIRAVCGHFNDWLMRLESSPLLKVL
jgi:hypothetical protein